MLDGRNEIAEDLCFGVKALRDIVYFKTLSKVDFENWWKEFSTFIIAPLRRTTSKLKGTWIGEDLRNDQILYRDRLRSVKPLKLEHWVIFTLCGCFVIASKLFNFFMLLWQLLLLYQFCEYCAWLHKSVVWKVFLRTVMLLDNMLVN